MRKLLHRFPGKLFLGITLLCISQAAYAQKYNTKSPTQCITAAGGLTTITLTGVPTNPDGSADITFYAAGDLDATTEYFELKSETGYILGKSAKTTLCATVGSVTFTVPKDSIKKWTADG